MYENWQVNAIVVLATAAAVALSVLVHYEGLQLAMRGIGRLKRHRRISLLYAISAVLMLHVTQIWIFGIAVWTLLQWPAFGSLGTGFKHFFDAIYFSACTFTTVGYGDLTPSGPIRFLAGTESLTGFVLIAWSASFAFFEMDKHWRQK